MDSFRSMEWNSKWDWENLDMFGSKVTESPQKLQHSDWGIGEGEIDGGSFNLSGGGGGGVGAAGGGGGSGGSISDLMHGSSAKSSVSASTDCSSKQGLTTSNFSFEPFPKKSEMISGNGNSQSSVDASVGSGEPLIGLTLGKRAYFENSSCTGSNGKSSSFSANPPPASSSSTTRKLKISSSCQKGSLVSRCQVEGCNLDLSSSKEYHRKHRVCESHSKSSKVVVAGVERRFCQQCSRFHSVGEFDDKKRSCRRRLNDHNARRRKPQQETLHFNSARLSTASYDGRQQEMGFVLNNFPQEQSRGVGMNSNWESGSKFTQPPKGFHVLKPEKMVVGSSFIDNRHHHHQQLPSPGTFSIPPNHETRCMLPPCRPNPSSSVFGQDLKEPILVGNIDAAAPDFGRALSLLSTTTNSWGYDPGPCSALAPMHHVIAHSNIVMTQQHQHHHMTMMHDQPQGFPLVSSSSSEYWNSSNDAPLHVHAAAAPPENNNASSTSHFHLLKTPHHPPSFYSNHLN